MKYTLLSVLSVLTFISNAQDIPNGNFEEWQNVGGWFDNPTGWTTQNNQLMVNTEKDEMPCGGDYAMQVRPIPGLETIMGTAQTGFPITAIPPQLNFCVKSNVVFGDVFVDTCRVIISFWNAGNNFYSEEWVNTLSIMDWTTITLPLNQIEPLMDSCSIEVQASYPSIGLGSGSPDT